jgi:hypothetical protein
MLILAVLIRLGAFAGIKGFLPKEGRDRPVSPGAVLTAIEREIALLEARAEHYRLGGGSGMWTARFAASWRRRRLAELRLHRQRLLVEMRRWRLSRNQSTAVCLERLPSKIQTRDGLPISSRAVQTFDVDRLFPPYHPEA